MLSAMYALMCRTGMTVVDTPGARRDVAGAAVAGGTGPLGRSVAGVVMMDMRGVMQGLLLVAVADALAAVHLAVGVAVALLRGMDHTSRTRRTSRVLAVGGRWPATSTGINSSSTDNRGLAVLQQEQHQPQLLTCLLSHLVQ